MRIGIDILGGDFAPEVPVKGAIAALNELPEGTTLVLIGDQAEATDIIEREGISPSLFEFIPTTDAIGMAEHPVKALMSKPNSSIALGFGLLKAGKIDAFASTGNTGAMLVGSMQSVKAIPGVIRPCISTVLPQLGGGFSIMLDVGTNADCKSDVLYQFGLLGSVYAKEVFGTENPRVALLNIGEEEEKGNLLAKASFNLMKDNGLYNFIGNVEGRDLFTDQADVIVCDGFTGNVVLKQAEGFYALMKKRGIEDEYFDRFNYENYGGTPVLGVNGNVIIGHGSSNVKATANMIKLATEVAIANLSEKIKDAFN